MILRRPFALLAACCLAAAAATSAQGADPEPGHFVPFTPLSQKELYAKRMRFSDGEPMISVGIMEGQAEVRVQADGPARLMFDEIDLPKTVYTPPETELILRPQRGKGAELLYWAVVDTKKYADTDGAQAAKASWEKKGQAAQVFEVGTVVSLQGNVLDTRERHVAVGGYTDRKKAEALINRLSQEEGLRPFLHEELKEVPSGTIAVYDERGRLLHKAQDSLYFGTVEGGRIFVKQVEHSRGYQSHGRQDRSFWGHLYVSIDRTGRLTVINAAGAERLLGGLVPAEIFPTAPLEALKAQAVTARGEVFSKLGHRHFGEPYHLCSEQHCQVYAGAGYERPETNRAVLETRGLLAVRPREGKEPLNLVDSVYSSTCGGFSEANEVVWDHVASASLRAGLDGMGSDPALSEFADGLHEGNIRRWLESYPPTECARSSFVKADKFRWKKTLQQPLLDKLLSPHRLGKLLSVDVLGRGQGGRVTGLRLIGTQRSVDILRELPVRRLFGNLSSGMFVVDQVKNGRGEVTSLTFTGGGWGHGVGMCQVGAIGRAERGQEFRQILSHYYGGAVVERIY